MALFKSGFPETFFPGLSRKKMKEAKGVSQEIGNIALMFCNEDFSFICQCIFELTEKTDPFLNFPDLMGRKKQQHQVCRGFTQWNIFRSYPSGSGERRVGFARSFYRDFCMFCWVIEIENPEFRRRKFLSDQVAGFIEACVDINYSQRGLGSIYPSKCVKARQVIDIGRNSE